MSTTINNISINLFTLYFALLLDTALIIHTYVVLPLAFVRALVGMYIIICAQYLADSLANVLCMVASMMTTYAAHNITKLSHINRGR